MFIYKDYYTNTLYKTYYISNKERKIYTKDTKDRIYNVTLYKYSNCMVWYYRM